MKTMVMAILGLLVLVSLGPANGVNMPIGTSKDTVLGFHVSEGFRSWVIYQLHGIDEQWMAFKEFNHIPISYGTEFIGYINQFVLGSSWQ